MLVNAGYLGLNSHYVHHNHGSGCTRKSCWLKSPIVRKSYMGISLLFSASSVYGNEIMGSSGQIASPLYPRTYPNNADYRWTVTVDSDSHIQIQFLDIDIEDLFSCYYDKLKVCTLV